MTVHPPKDWCHFVVLPASLLADRWNQPVLIGLVSNIGILPSYRLIPIVWYFLPFQQMG